MIMSKMRRKNIYPTKSMNEGSSEDSGTGVGAGGPLDTLARGRVTIVGLSEELVVSTKK